MKNLSQITLDKIKRKKIKPSSRWKFLLRNYSWWFAGIFSILIGGLISSVVFYMLINNDWDIYERIGSNLLSFILITMPYFWLLFFILFIILTDYYLKHTKYGYRFSLVRVILISILITLILGWIFYNAGVGEMIDAKFSERIPMYNSLIHGRDRVWMHAENGLLVGTISEIRDNNFTIIDMNNKEWIIESNDLPLDKMNNFLIGNVIRIIGRIKNDAVFTATEIRFRHGKRKRIRRKGLLNK